MELLRNKCQKFEGQTFVLLPQKPVSVLNLNTCMSRPKQMWSGPKAIPTKFVDAKSTINNWMLLCQIYFYELFWVEIVDIIEDYAMRCQVVNMEWHFPSFLATLACSLGYASMPCSWPAAFSRVHPADTSNRFVWKGRRPHSYKH